MCQEGVPGMRSKPLRHDWSCGGRRIDLERESIDLSTHALFSGGNWDRGDGIPKFAVHEDFSGWSQRGFGDSDFAYQALFAGYYFVASGAHGDGSRKANRAKAG